MALGQKAFSSPENLRALTAITSPEIKDLLLENFAYYEHKVPILATEGAIIIESNAYKYFDEIWVVCLPKEMAVGRILKRNPELSEKEARDRI